MLACVVLLTNLACADPAERRESGPPARTPRDVQSAFHLRLGRTWELAVLGTREIPPPRAPGTAPAPGMHPGPGTRPTIRFTTDTSLGASTAPTGARSAGGWSFCNGYGTAYTLGPGDSLRFHGFQSTLVGCNGPDSLETRFFRALHLTQRIALAADTLRLIAADGSSLTFVAVDSTGASAPRAPATH